MRRFIFTLILISCVAAGVYYFKVMAPRQEAAAVAEKQLYMGDPESGCCFPISQVSDGKNPIWWSEKQRDWNQFGSRTEAISAGFRECPQ